MCSILCPRSLWKIALGIQSRESKLKQRSVSLCAWDTLTPRTCERVSLAPGVPSSHLENCCSKIFNLHKRSRKEEVKTRRAKKNMKQIENRQKSVHWVRRRGRSPRHKQPEPPAPPAPGCVPAGAASPQGSHLRYSAPVCMPRAGLRGSAFDNLSSMGSYVLGSEALFLQGLIGIDWRLLHARVCARSSQTHRVLSSSLPHLRVHRCACAGPSLGDSTRFQRAFDEPLGSRGGSQGPAGQSTGLTY